MPLFRVNLCALLPLKRKPAMSIKNAKQSGVTLIELIVFIVIVSVALVGVLKVLDVTNRGSADPLVRKQALSIAESLLLEIEQQAFTLCDPDDSNVSTATTAAGCATTAQDPAPTTAGAITGPFPNAESRYSSTNPFDNVADYGGFTMPGGGCTGICSPGDTTPLSGLNAYTASVTITRAGAAAPFASFPLDAVLKISVHVTGPANTDVTLNGYRVRYAPNI
jgi:MSHA pilin protein MshD